MQSAEGRRTVATDIVATHTTAMASPNENTAAKTRKIRNSNGNEEK
jgi:hypothetical protein